MKHISLLVLYMMSLAAYAQNVGIGTKNPQNKLHVAGGLRVDSLAAKKDSGIILHNKTGDVYSLSLTGKKSDVLRGDGTFASAALPTDAWLLGGNAGTDSTTNFIGTTDNQPLRFRVNNNWFGSLGPNVSFGLNSYGSAIDPNGPETTLPDNVAIGNYSLGRNNRGDQNVAIGSETLRELFGDRNTAVGYHANRGFEDPVNAIGSGNTAVGASSLQQNSYGNENTAIGLAAMSSNRGGSTNTAVGAHSLTRYGPGGPSTPGGNVAIGAFSLGSNLSGGLNTAVGYEALLTATNPQGETAIGYQALRSNDNGANNTAVGAFALFRNTGGFSNVATGMESLSNNRNGSDNTAYGAWSLLANMNGNQNTAVGQHALSAATSGEGLTAIGANALGSTTTGMELTAVGYQALASNTTGNGHTAIGYKALVSNTTGTGNTATGTAALIRNGVGNYNTSTGNQSLYANISGSYNSALGYKTLFTNTTGSNNTGTGFKALNFNTTGSRNTASGFQALNTNTTGNNNTAIGYNADVTTGNLTNATAIGYEAKVNASNKVRIGNASVTVIEGQVPFTTPSDGRFKYNVKEDVSGLDFILKLRPVTYQFDVKKFDNIGDVTFASSKYEGYEKAAFIRRTGFIAQEVEKAAQEANYDFSGILKPENEKGHYSLSYESFVVPLVKGMQEQDRKITQLAEIIEAQNEKLEKQQQVIEKQQRMIDELLKSAKNK